MAKADNPLSWPVTCLQLEARGYRLQEVRPCKLCGLTIEIWRSRSRAKQKPLALERRERGGRVPHWITCPRAAERHIKSQQRDLFS